MSTLMPQHSVTENHCLAVRIYISPEYCLKTRAKHAHTVNNYLTVSLLLLSHFYEEAVLRQEKYAWKNQSQLNSYHAAPGDTKAEQTGNQSFLLLPPRLSDRRPATEKEQQSVRLVQAHISTARAQVTPNPACSSVSTEPLN